MNTRQSRARRVFHLGHLQPTAQLLIMLGFTLFLVALFALAGYLLPGSLTGAAPAP
ncbi:MAG: hypothetical protein ACOCSK_03300 [Rhodothermales bacterium]